MIRISVVVIYFANLNVKAGKDYTRDQTSIVKEIILKFRFTLLIQLTSGRVEQADGNKGRWNFNCDPTPADKGAAESKPAFRLIARTHVFSSSLELILKNTKLLLSVLSS